jgi:GR25 family glycosyltransferase involved in LPS biosynthesis
MITINGYDFADVGYYINLDSRTDRRERIDKQFKDYKIFGVERHPANTSTSSKPLNCKISHYEIYKKFLSQSAAETLLVLEDDCLFLPYLFDHTQEIYSNISKTKYDLFWLGCRNRRWPKPYKNQCYLVQSVAHTQSYIISRNLCKYIVDKIPEQGHNGLAIDELLCLIPYGYDVLYDPHKFGFYDLDNPVDSLETQYISLCYERALTTQYASYSDLTEADTDMESYITSSFPVT